MARLCEVCRSERRNDIDLDIVSGVRPAQLAVKYSPLSEGSLRRHKDSGHMGGGVTGELVLRSRAELLSEAEATASAIINKLAVQVHDAEAIQAAALERQLPTVALKAMAEARSSMALLAKIALVEGAQGNTKEDSELKDELEAVVRAMRLVLPAYTECAKAIATELQKSGHFQIAAAVTSLVVF